MANQIIIDIGAVANDGTGDPLRTAFGYVNNNFSNIWATGVANSNISFSGNKILTTNTNGNLVLAPNGIGKVQSNVDIVPNANNTLSLGSLTRQWNTVYAQNLDVSGDTTFNNLTVNGNLTVDGDIIQIGNLVTDAKTIQLANTAGTANAANGSGVTVGANDNIATLLYNSTSNVWSTNIGITATGNISGTYFIGNGSLLTGITSYGNANVTTLLASFGSNTIATTGNITGGYILGNGSQLTGLPESYGNANVAAYLPTYTGNLAGGNLTVSSAGNTWTIANQFLTAPGGAYWHSHPEQNSDDFVSAPGADIKIQSINANSVVESQIDLTSTNIELVVVNGVTKTWKFNEFGITELPGDITPVTAGGATANVGNVSNPWTNAYVSGNVSAGNITTTGNITADYFFGNGSQLTDLTTNRISNGTSNVDIATANGNVVITSNDTYNWTFGTDGNTILPGQSGWLTSTANASVYFAAMNNGIDPIATISNWDMANGMSSTQIEVRSDNVWISTDGTGTQKDWIFDNTGVLTVPGNIVMPAFSSLVGDGASPAPSISGFSNGGFGGNVSVTGNITGGNLSVTGNISGNTAGYAIGYRDIPQVSFTGNATIATTDAGKHFYSTQSTNYTLTIANNASQGFQVGAAITIVNQGTGTITIAQGSGVTLYLAGNATSGNRSVATFGMATIMKVATDTWFINGTGVS